jgi:hypothetical protein
MVGVVDPDAVWFVADDRTLWLLPVSGSDTQWYRNLEKDRAITIEAGEMRRNLRARLLKDERTVHDVIRQFRERYTPEEIKRWYKGLDVAVQISLHRDIKILRQGTAQNEILNRQRQAPDLGVIRVQSESGQSP